MPVLSCACRGPNDAENGMSYRLPLDLDALRARIHDGQSFTYVPFYGHSAEPGRITNAVYSQFYPAEFNIDGERYRWAEQWMMAAKARLFGDQEALAAILAADGPLDCKRIGRTVRNYDDGRWSAGRFDLVVEGNIAKFSQNAALRDHLLGSGDAILVEAAPRDQVWGIGYGRDNPAVQDPLRWRGRNLLGFALVKVRAILRGELLAPNSQRH
jgi:ribA/ribD-fused uncharacterized protein